MSSMALVITAKPPPAKRAGYPIGDTKRAERMLELAQMLYSGKEINVPMMVRAFDISRATAKRDMALVKQVLHLQRRMDHSTAQYRLVDRRNTWPHRASE